MKVTVERRDSERVPINETEWYRGRLRCVQKRIDSHPPDQLYRIRSTGHIVPIHAYIVDQRQCNRCIIKLLKINNPDQVIQNTKMEIAFDDLEMLSHDTRRRYA